MQKDILDMLDELEAKEANISVKIEEPEEITLARKNPPYLKRTLEAIHSVDEYAHNRGSMGLDFGFENLNKAFNGLNPGLALFAGSSNTGKSALLLEIMGRVIRHNQFQNQDHPKKAYCIYFSLDDSNNELMPRMVASEQGLLINQVLFPKTIQDKPIILEKRQQGFNNLKQNAPFFSMFDAEYGQSIQHIEKTIGMIYEELELFYPNEYQIVVFIDNFHDINYESDTFMEDNQKYDYISGRLNELAIKYNSPIVCSAEFRKTNSLKRPSLDEVKSSGKIVYEAKSIILVHNEVGIKGENAEVYWNLSSNDPTISDRKMPVLEMHVAKNKFGPFKGRDFLRFQPEMARFIEPSQDEVDIYRQALRG